MAHRECGSCGKAKRAVVTSVYSVSDYGDTESETQQSQGRQSYRISFASGKALAGIPEYNAPSNIRSISEHERGEYKFYRPTSTRTYILALFLLAFGLSVIFLELAVAAHPNASKVPDLLKRDVLDGNGHLLWARQETSSENGAGATPTTNQGGVTTSNGQTSQPNASDQLSITTPSTPTTTATPGQPNQADQLTITTAPSPSPTPTTNNAVSEPPASSAPPAPASSEQPASSSPSAAGQQDGASSTPAAAPAASSASTDLPAEQSPSAASGEGTTPAAQASSSGPKGSVVTDLGLNGRTSSTTGKGEQILTEHSTGTDTGVPTAAVTQDAASTGTAGASSEDPASNGTFTQFDYFLSKYFPTLMGVTLQSTWLVVFVAFKMMEPFYQLASPGGGSAALTLTADYLSGGLSFNFAKVAFQGDWVLFLAGTVQMLLGIIVTLVSEAMNVKATAYCKTSISDRQPCSPVWVVNVGIIRAIEVFLIMCFVMVLAMIVLNRRRVSGVFLDPSRIATMADLLVHEPLIEEFRRLPPEATKEQIEEALADSRYMLGTFVDASGQQKYGVIKLEECDGSHHSSHPKVWYRTAFSRLDACCKSFEARLTYGAYALPFFGDSITVLLLVFLFTIILAYWCVTGQSQFNDWMNGGDIGPTMLLTAAGVVMGFFFKGKEHSLRLAHPYVLLSKSPTKPASETLVAGTSGTPFGAVRESVNSRDVSLALMSSGAILCDLLLIMIPGVPFTRAQTRQVYEASTWTCLVMLVLIFAAQARVICQDWRRDARASDDCPDTLATVFMRLCGSRFVEEKNRRSLHPMSEKEIGMSSSSSSISVAGLADQHTHHKQKARYDGLYGERRYRYSYMQGVDGVARQTVDHDEL